MPPLNEILARLLPEAERGKALLANTFTLESEKFPYYGAGRRFDGSPDYNHWFWRDFSTGSRMVRNAPMLHSGLRLCARFQAEGIGPHDAAEPGKFPHEVPGVEMRGLNSQFCADDTTALWLLCLGDYVRWTADAQFALDHQKSILAAHQYLERHTPRDLFLTDPSFCGADRYALAFPYFRDVGIATHSGKSIRYPMTLLLVQAQAVAAFRALVFLAQERLVPLNPEHLEKKASKMCSALFTLFFEEGKRYPAVFMDRKQKAFLPYADAAHALWYLEPDDVPPRIRSRIVALLEELATPFGFLAHNVRQDPVQRLLNKFLGKPEDFPVAIWPLDQGCIAQAAARFSLPSWVIECSAQRPVQALASCGVPLTEYLLVENGSARPGGCPVQFWTCMYIEAMAKLWEDFQGRS